MENNFVPVFDRFTNTKFPAANLMLDIETLGVPTMGKYNVQILTLALVPMGLLNGLVEPLYIKIEPKTDSRFFTTESTLLWWNEQEPEVKVEALSGVMTQEEAASKFMDYWNECVAEIASLNTSLQASNQNQVCIDIGIWGNGNEFDCNIVQAWLEILGHNTPWKFYNSHSMRTAHMLYPEIQREFPPKNIAHNALIDATYQAKSIHKMLTGELL